MGGGAPDKTETFFMLISPITWVDKTMELPWVALRCHESLKRSETSNFGLVISQAFWASRSPGHAPHLRPGDLRTLTPWLHPPALFRMVRRGTRSPTGEHISWMACPLFMQSSAYAMCVSWNLNRYCTRLAWEPSPPDRDCGAGMPCLRTHCRAKAAAQLVSENAFGHA